MKVKFWGVRGSIPTPLTPYQIQSKIAAVVQSIKKSDLESSESREFFLAHLPPYIMGTVGGNTTCIEVEVSRGQKLIFDAGSGLREFGAHELRLNSRPSEYHVFLSHFHWDHIQGLPFFSQAFNPSKTIHFYSPIKNFKSILQDQMKEPYFPVPMAIFPAKIIFHELDEQPLHIADTEITWRKVHHPGTSFSYKIKNQGKQLIFSTDTELKETDFERTDENFNFYSGTDAIILDSQYTLDEAIEKYDWGHTSYSLAVDFASEWNIKKLILFHHEPSYDDKKIHTMLKSARWYAGHLDNTNMEIFLATEDLSIQL